MILTFLHLKEIVHLRMVSKGFKKLVSIYRSKEIIFNKSNSIDNFKLKDNWFFIRKPINYLNSLDCYSPSLFDKPAFDVRTLKLLRIANLPDVKIKLSQLNKLCLLEQLELFSQIEIDLDELRLPKLRRLVFKAKLEAHLLVRCEQLQSIYLNCGLLKFLKFEYPDRIVDLQANLYDRKFSKFNNLRTLQLVQSLDLNQSVLANFPDLRTLKVQSRWFESKRKLTFLMRKQIALERKANLVFYCGGVRLVDDDELNVLNFNHRGDLTLSLQMHNYSLLSNEDLDWVHEIDYVELLNLIHQLPFDLVDRLPVNFFNLFTNIQEITVKDERNDQIDEAQLIRFISRCRNLNKLSIGLLLSQTFYDQLPSVKPLVTLELDERTPARRLNLEFVTQIQYLHTFKLDRDLGTATIQALVVSKCLTYLVGLIDCHYIVVQKLKQGKYYCFSDYFKLYKTLNDHKDLLWFVQFLKTKHLDYLSSNYDHEFQDYLKRLQ